MTLSVIPGRRVAASPESITTILSIWHDRRPIVSFVFMGSGLRPAAGPGMTMGNDARTGPRDARQCGRRTGYTHDPA